VTAPPAISSSVPLRVAACAATAAIAAGAVVWWAMLGAPQPLAVREPIPGNRPRQHKISGWGENPGALVRGGGAPGEDIGSWPCFRGAERANVASGTTIASTWPADGPKEVWRVELGEGHAGAAVHAGRVYVLDYDTDAREDALRCISLADGEDIWRYSYSVRVKRNHGMSRTVPAVTDRHVVSIGPKCHVLCVKSRTGELVWKKDLAGEYGADVPEWYAGQCPLVDRGRAIVAIGGSALMAAFDLETGEAAWETPPIAGWTMTHASVLPVDFAGGRQYVWESTGGAVGVDAETGKVLWKHPGWTVRTANVPTTVDLGRGRLLFTGGYGTGAMVGRLIGKGGGIEFVEEYRTRSRIFGSDQHTPILHEGHVYAVTPGGALTCMTLEGKLLWKDTERNYGLGPYMFAGGKFLVLDDKPPTLCLLEVSPDGFEVKSSHRVSGGYDAWAPMAFAGGMLLLRDATTMFCYDLR